MKAFLKKLLAFFGLNGCLKTEINDSDDFNNDHLELHDKNFHRDNEEKINHEEVFFQFNVVKSGSLKEETTAKKPEPLSDRFLEKSSELKNHFEKELEETDEYFNNIKDGVLCLIKGEKLKAADCFLTPLVKTKHKKY